MARKFPRRADNPRSRIDQNGGIRKAGSPGSVPGAARAGRRARRRPDGGAGMNRAAAARSVPARPGLASPICRPRSLPIPSLEAAAFFTSARPVYPALVAGSRPCGLGKDGPARRWPPMISGMPRMPCRFSAKICLDPPSAVFCGTRLRLNRRKTRSPKPHAWRTVGPRSPKLGGIRQVMFITRKPAPDHVSEPRGRIADASLPGRGAVA